MSKILKNLPLVILAILFSVFFLTKGGTNIDSSVASCPDGETGDVILYATQWCGYCKKARKIMQANNVSYCEHDIEESSEGERQYNALKGNGIPLMVIDEKIYRGYDEAALLSAANR